MKTSFRIAFLLGLFTTAAIAAIDDPIKDYLTGRENVFMRGDDTFYADDVVFVLDLDLRGNGQIERLVSSSLDRDGKAGVNWTIYDKDGNGWKRVSVMTFPLGFYLGKIDELNNQYGVVSFWPSGNQEGAVVAHVFNGSTIKEKKIGDVERDFTTRQLKGTHFLKRYFSGGKENVQHPAVRTIDVKDLARNYGLKSDPRKQLDALRENYGGVRQ